VDAATLGAWSDIALKAFFGDEPNEVGATLTKLMETAGNIRRYLALWNGEPAGSASLTCGLGVAVFGGGATKPDFRGKGLQTALLRRRIEDAKSEADVATMGARPGSGSHRNAERLGFRIAHTQLSLRVPMLA